MTSLNPATVDTGQSHGIWARARRRGLGEPMAKLSTMSGGDGAVTLSEGDTARLLSERELSATIGLFECAYTSRPDSWWNDAGTSATRGRRFTLCMRAAAWIATAAASLRALNTLTASDGPLSLPCRLFTAAAGSALIELEATIERRSCA